MQRTRLYALGKALDFFEERRAEPSGSVSSGRAVICLSRKDRKALSAVLRGSDAALVDSMGAQYSPEHDLAMRLVSI